MTPTTPAPVAPEPADLQDEACELSVWWMHNKSRFTTARQAAHAAWRAALAGQVAPAAAEPAGPVGVVHFIGSEQGVGWGMSLEFEPTNADALAIGRADGEKLYVYAAATVPQAAATEPAADDAEKFAWLRQTTHPDNLRKLMNGYPGIARPAAVDEPIRLAYKTGYDEGYSDASDGLVDHDACEEGWQQYRASLTVGEGQETPGQPADERAAFEAWVTTKWRPDDGAQLLAREFPRFAFAAWQARAALAATVHPAEAAAPAPTIDPNEVDHPTSRYFFKAVLARLGVQPGERIDVSLKKLYAAIPAPSLGHQAERVGEKPEAVDDDRSVHDYMAALSPISNAMRSVIAERHRQVDVEGWTPEHDDEHDDGAMAVAAACYALADRKALEVQTVRIEGLWQWTGWSALWFKPKDRRRNLVRAGALLLAEIERLDRAAMPLPEAPKE